jgi:hypothetical protein
MIFRFFLLSVLSSISFCSGFASTDSLLPKESLKFESEIADYLSLKSENFITKYHLIPYEKSAYFDERTKQIPFEKCLLINDDLEEGISMLYLFTYDSSESPLYRDGYKAQLFCFSKSYGIFFKKAIRIQETFAGIGLKVADQKIKFELNNLDEISVENLFYTLRGSE